MVLNILNGLEQNGIEWIKMNECFYHNKEGNYNFVFFVHLLINKFRKLQL